MTILVVTEVGSAFPTVFKCFLSIACVFFFWYAHTLLIPSKLYM